MKSTLYLLFMLLLLSPNASAEIIYVPDDYSLIQDGINSAHDGDTILVEPGTYAENLNLNGKNIVVASRFLTERDSSYIRSTIVDGDSAGTVFSVNSGEDSTTTILGFTIRNGFAPYGGGFYISSSSPVIRDNIIEDNYMSGGGGGLYCAGENTNALIMNNIIRHNQGNSGGGIFAAQASTPVIENNMIYENATVGIGAAMCIMESSLRISGNTIKDNYTHYPGGGIMSFDSDIIIANNCIIGNEGERGGGIVILNYVDDMVRIINNVIYGNNATDYGGGLVIAAPNHEIKNNIFWANTADNHNPQIFGESPRVTYCCVEGGFGGAGNISDNPLFRDADTDDYRLSAIECGQAEDSPCKDTGDPTIFDAFIDCEDGGIGDDLCDMGAYGGAGIPTGIDEQQPKKLPVKYSMLSNYPNPFNATTSIVFTLKRESEVNIDIYNVRGQKIEPLVNSRFKAGEHIIRWNAEDFATGIYFCKLKSPDGEICKPLMLIK
ncbi:MAG: T9SS type A sorting domain-containing protein [candidate division Zixibacteria bacterium]|nr:T9SS type A sorting domain-containing protein [candidate division Zixibacteria bacterium]